MRRKVIPIVFALIFLLSINSFTPKIKAADRQQSKLQVSLYNYLSVEANRKSVEKAARKLNKGNPHNTCVYFISESLRRVGYKVPKSICNTKQMVSFLKANGWKVSYNLQELKPGDICFTTNTPMGYPSHGQIFMGWVKKGSIEYAYIVDNQSYDYKGNSYHIRNIKRKQNDKDATKFFMFKAN